MRISIFPLEWVIWPLFERGNWDYNNNRPCLSRIYLGPIAIYINPPKEHPKYD